MKLKKIISLLAVSTLLIQSGVVFAEGNEETVPPSTDIPLIENTEEIPAYSDLVKVAPKPTGSNNGSTGGATPVAPPSTPVVSPNEKSEARKKVDEIKRAETKEEKAKLLEDIEKKVDETLSTLTTYDDSKELLDTTLELTNAIVSDKNSDVSMVEKALEKSQEVALKALKSKSMSSSQKLAFSKEYLESQKSLLAKDSELVGKSKMNQSVSTFAKEAIAEMTKVDIKENKLGKEQITKALNEAKNIKNGLKSVMTKDQQEELDQGEAISVVIDDTSKDKSLRVEAEVAKVLADNKADLAIETGDVTFIIKADTLAQMASKGVEMKQEPVDKVLPKKDDLSPTKATWDFSLNDTEGNAVNFEDKPSIRIDLAEVGSGVDQGLLGVYIYEPTTEEYEYVPTRIDQATNEIVFDAPHFSIYTVMELDKEYSDTANAWANREIKVLSAMHIINGVGDNNFDPNGTLTRAQYAKMLVVGLGLTTGETENYSDVDDNAWYADIARIARANDLMVNSESFNGDEKLSREEMAYMTAKALEYSGTFNALTFADTNLIDEYAKSAVGYLVSRGDIQGSRNSEGTFDFNPKGFLTRQEAVKVLYNVLDLN